MIPAQTAGTFTPPGQTSATIAVTRVLCILGIVYVHAWTGLSGGELAALSSTNQGILRWSLVELLGRTSVPLLGMISGWLIAASTSTRSYPAFVSAKARTLLLPMLLWNGLSILLVSGTAYIWHLQAPIPHSLFWLVDELLCLVRPNDINVQTPFLRDLFLCMVAAPLLLRLPRPWLAVAAVALMALIVAGWPLPPILRPQILLFFMAGIMARRAGIAEQVALMPAALAVLPFALLAPAKIWLSVQGAPPLSPVTIAVDLGLRFAAALMVWRMACGIAASPLAEPIRRLEPYAFFIFCSHLILIWLGGPLIGQLTGPMGSPAYPFFLLAQPVLVAAAAIPLARLLVRVAPATANLLSGGRLKESPKVGLANGAA